MTTKAETAEFAELKAENERLKREIASKETADFIDGLIKEGRFLPKNRSRIEALFRFAEYCDNSENVFFSEFQEGESESTVQILKEYLKDSPPVITFGEIAKKDNAYNGGATADSLQYDENLPFRVIELDGKIRKYMKENNTDYTTAFNAITGATK